MAQYKDLSHRRAKCRLRITDAQGRPAADATLEAKQTNHEFLFGCGAFDMLTYANHTDQDSPETLAFFKERTDKWLALFNYGTLPFYWGGYEPVEGQPQTASRMNAAEFLQDQGIKVKGHPLCWHTACANWLMEYDNETILKKQLDRITRDVTAFRGVVDMWDVINEVVIMPVFDRYDNAITRICKDLGQTELVRKVFTAAKEANPDAELLLNDFNTSAAYEKLIDDCLNAGAPITAIGIQSHQHQGYWGAEKLEEVLERYERFGLPIHFTENSLVAGPLVPPELTDLNDYHYEDGVSTPEYEERQKTQLEEMYRILFAHPQVKAVTNWDFTDGMWLNAPTGVLRKDNSPKPVYDMLLQLIKKEWWTDCKIHTNADGMTEIEGFHGDYLLTADGKSATLKLTEDAKDLNIQLL